MWLNKSSKCELHQQTPWEIPKAPGEWSCNPQAYYIYCNILFEKLFFFWRLWLCLFAAVGISSGQLHATGYLLMQFTWITAAIAQWYMCCGLVNLRLQVWVQEGHLAGNSWYFFPISLLTSDPLKRGAAKITFCFKLRKIVQVYFTKSVCKANLAKRKRQVLKLINFSTFLAHCEKTDKKDT